MTAASRFQHGQATCTGVLLSNLGTPDAPDTPALRRYLRQFLSDPRVVELPRVFWLPLLYGVILNTRPAKSAAKYRSVWTDEGAPLLAISQHQCRRLEQRLAELCPGPVRVALGMRYGNPSLSAALHQLREAGARRILLLPLYPQYSAATTASTFDAVARELRRWRWLPELRLVADYHTEPAYIQALADSLREAWRSGERGERLLFSFHGLPARNLLAGDPYHCQCHATARLVAENLGLEDGTWTVSFQSRFGAAEWLKPYTDETLKEWATQGIKRVDVACPGFSADCLETLEEMGMENRDLFLAAGGQTYRYLPALNDRPDHIDMMTGLVRRHGAGWPELEPDYDPQALARRREEQRQRALVMGAEA